MTGTSITKQNIREHSVTMSHCIHSCCCPKFPMGDIQQTRIVSCICNLLNFNCRASLSWWMKFTDTQKQVIVKCSISSIEMDFISSISEYTHLLGYFDTKKKTQRDKNNPVVTKFIENNRKTVHCQIRLPDYRDPTVRRLIGYWNGALGYFCSHIWIYQ